MDDAILKYLDDDGTMVEPEFYTPIIPFILVNGSQGIGTGFSTSIPPYNPLDLTADLRARLSGDEPREEFVPYYEGFRGTVRPIAQHKFLIKGCYTRVDDNTITITELPIGTWTMPYLTFLEELIEPPVSEKTVKRPEPILKDMSNYSTESTVEIRVVFPRGKLAELEAASHDHGVNGVEKTLKLTTTVSTTNMNLFTGDLKLKKYTTVSDIITDYMEIRMGAYVRRKEFLLGQMEVRLKKMSNRARYILEVLDDTIDLRRKTAQQIHAMLSERGYDEDPTAADGGYKYLTKMPMDSVSKENVETILREKEETEREMEILVGTTETQMWLNELATFETEYMKYKAERAGAHGGAKAEGGAAKKKIVKRAVAKK
jgi:DNA topoisomerase-2